MGVDKDTQEIDVHSESKNTKTTISLKNDLEQSDTFQYVCYYVLLLTALGKPALDNYENHFTTIHHISYRR